jgi:hypothetical protein
VDDDDDASQQDAEEVIRLSLLSFGGLLMAHAKTTTLSDLSVAQAARHTRDPRQESAAIAS